MLRRILLLALLAAGAMHAEFLRIEVFMRDMNCQPCSDSLVAAFQKIKGVEHAEVAFQAGTVRLDLAAQNRIGVDQTWDAIKRVGFTPGETKVTVRGAVKTEAGKTWLEVTEINRTFAVEGGKFTTGATVEVKGRITPPPDPRTPVIIRVD
jgi:cation transport ATPase